MSKKMDVDFMVINAFVEGNMNAENASILIEKNGFFTGHLKGKTVDIGGTFKGTVTAQRKVLLREQSHVDGEIMAESFEVHEGASGDFSLQVRTDHVLSAETEDGHSVPGRVNSADTYDKEKSDSAHEHKASTAIDDRQPLKTQNNGRENYWS